MIYLDNNATTKTDEKVLEEMLPYLKEEYAKWEDHRANRKKYTSYNDRLY